MKKRLNSISYRVILFLFVTVISDASAQRDTLNMTLDNIIELAQSDAPNVLLAQTRLNNSYWQYQSFRADYKPRIDLFGTLPDVNRSLEAITLPTGEDEFVSRSIMRNSLDLSLQQDLAFTGGSISLFSSLERLDIFTSNTTSYLFSPLSLRISQPIFRFNELKWNKRIEPLRYEESKLRYSEEMEQVAFDAANLFFNVFEAQLNEQAAKKYKANADTLLALSQGRFEVGRIAETDLLQIELSAMREETNLASAVLNLQSAIEALRNFLGITENVYFELEAPTDIPGYNIDLDMALSQASLNRQDAVQFQRRLIQANLNVARAQGDRGPTIDVQGRFGLQQSSDELSQVTQNLLDQQRFSVNLQVPIADFGKAKSRIQVAESNRKLEIMNVQQDRINFQREVTLKVQQFDLVRRQVEVARRAYEIAQKRQTITRKRYLIGKIGLTELNLAITEEDNARRSFISALRNFWLAHYELRTLTLYDFERGRPLVRQNPEEVGD